MPEEACSLSFLNTLRRSPIPWVLEAFRRNKGSQGTLEARHGGADSAGGRRIGTPEPGVYPHTASGLSLLETLPTCPRFHVSRKERGKTDPPEGPPERKQGQEGRSRYPLGRCLRRDPPQLPRMPR